MSTTRQELLLTLLMEECAVIIQAVSNIKRFTADHSPISRSTTNREELEIEYNDMLATVELLGETGLEIRCQPTLIELKKRKIEHYLNISKQLGQLSDS